MSYYRSSSKVPFPTCRCEKFFLVLLEINNNPDMIHKIAQNNDSSFSPVFCNISFYSKIHLLMIPLDYLNLSDPLEHSALLLFHIHKLLLLFPLHTFLQYFLAFLPTYSLGFHILHLSVAKKFILCLLTF